MVVLIAVSNRAVRTQRRHLGVRTHAALSLSETRPTLQDTCVPIPRALFLRASPSLLGRILAPH